VDAENITTLFLTLAVKPNKGRPLVLRSEAFRKISTTKINQVASWH
jgi:hypothetical protein